MRQGLGSEHPLCDRVQLLMVLLFFVAWGLILLVSSCLAIPRSFLKPLLFRFFSASFCGNGAGFSPQRLSCVEVS